MTSLAFVDDVLRICASPLTVVADGTDWGLRQAEVVGDMMAIAGRHAAETRLVFWSDAAHVLTRSPSLDHAERHSLAHRGRFITPFFEAGLFPAPGRVVVLVAGTVPDWDDWRQEPGAPGNGPIAVLLSSGEPPGGCTVFDLASEPWSAIRSSFERAVFAERITNVTVTFQGCIPTALPEGFIFEVPQPGESRAIWTGEWDGLEIAIGTASVGSGSVKAEVSDSLGGSVMCSVVRPAATPPLREWRPVGSGSAGLVDAIDAYRNGSATHRCVACGTTHRFESAFRCAHADVGFFDPFSRMMLSPDVSVGPDDIAFVRNGSAGLEVTITRKEAAVSLGETVALRGRSAWHLVDASGESVRTLPQIWPGLFGDADLGLWVVCS